MRIHFTNLFLLLTASFFSQNFCLSTEMQAKWFKLHPELKANFETLKQQAAQQDQHDFQNGYNHSQHKSTSATPIYTVPVVFHILHTGGQENISDAQVIDAVNILTRDYNRQNADTTNVVVQFKQLIGDIQFEFRLATKDPNGNCTNGIIRHWDTKTDWTGDYNDYIYSWPSNNYLNIYVVRTMGGGAAGYTFLPGTGVPTAVDAIVVLSSYVGSIGTSNVGLSRVLTHEVGHWFNLDHVWGGTNNPGVSCGDDGVSDTPITMGFSSCNLNNAAICNPGIVENVQNYMEYAYCDRMFTIGQAARMQSTINSPIAGRKNLSTPANLIATGIVNPLSNCVPKLNITAFPTFTVCAGRSISLNSFTYNAIPTSYAWTVNNGALLSNASSANPSLTLVNTGTVAVQCVVSNANGSSTETMVVTGLNSAPQITNTKLESFEDPSALLPANWKVINPTTPSEKWEIFSYGGSEGAASMYVPGESMTANSIELLESPSFDFNNNPGAVFTFKCAYAKKTVSQKDVFKVQASKNCGGSWSDVLIPGMNGLANASGGIDSNLYYPVPYQWVFKNVSDFNNQNFSPFRNEENVIFRFYFQEDVNGAGLGNRFYLDEVNFSTPLGINDLSRSIGFSVYPNPSKASVKLNFHLSDAANIRVKLLNISGSVVEETSLKQFTNGEHEIELTSNATLSAGIYFVNLELNGTKLSRKIVITN